MKTNSRLIFTFLVLLVVLSCCKDDDDGLLTCIDPTNPECPNYDPCHGVEPPSAAFTIQESILSSYPSNRWVWTPDDNYFMANGDIRFTSPFFDSKYKHTWYLGAEIIHDPMFVRSHAAVSNEQRPYQITVSHVLEYPLDNECFANATGKDSVARIYTLQRYHDELMSFGVYRGAFEGQRDSFDFAIRRIRIDGGRAERGDQSSQAISYFSNFHNEGDTLFAAIGFRNRLISFRNSFRPEGLLEIEPNSDQFTLQYRKQSSTGWSHYTVKGRKLNIK